MCTKKNCCLASSVYCRRRDLSFSFNALLFLCSPCDAGYPKTGSQGWRLAVLKHNFSQARRPSCCQTNSIKELKAQCQSRKNNEKLSKTKPTEYKKCEQSSFTKISQCFFHLYYWEKDNTTCNILFLYISQDGTKNLTNHLWSHTPVQQALQPIVGPPQYAPAPCKWWLEQPLRAFNLEVTAHVGDAGHRTPSVYHVWSS